MKLSVVATVYNDAEAVPLLVEEIKKYVIPVTQDYEIILVNDFSKDSSEKAIADECAKDARIKGVSLRRNFGQQIALSAGIHYSTGDYVIIMDGDLQNPPSAIPLLFDKIKEGDYDIVYTISKTRNSWLEGLTSRLFWFLLAKLFSANFVQNPITLRIMTKDFTDHIKGYGELNRTVDGILNDISWNYATIEVENRKRQMGHSHYNFFKRFNLMIDMIISISSAPLNVLIYLGFFAFLGSLLGSLYYLIIFFFFNVPQGYTSIQLSIFFFGGLIVLILGIIGRYLANIYLEVRNRPLFHIKKKYNL
jgi:dolichol-phosphate mannosyltransferase